MFDWLFEGQTTVYILLAAVLICFFFVYWQYRRKVWLIAMLVVVALLGVYWLLDRLVETDGEQVERQVKEMAAQMQAHNLDAVMRHLADDFHYKTFNKEQVRAAAAFPVSQVSEVKVWDFNRRSRPERGKDYDGLRFTFKMRGVGADDFWFDCVPVFEYDGAHGWRIKEFHIYKPGTTEELEVPLQPPS